MKRLGALLLPLVLGCGHAQSEAIDAAHAQSDAARSIDVGLENRAAKSYEKAATIFYSVYHALPEADPRRDIAGVNLADALVDLGYAQAGAEHYFDVLGQRRSPALMNAALVAIKKLYEKRLIEEARLVDGGLYGRSYAELDPEHADFVEYIQALTDVRRGFTAWGAKRLETLGGGSRPYAFAARYALAVQRVSKKEDDAAEADLRALMKDPKAQAPGEVKNKARLALARAQYEKKSYGEAWDTYRSVDMPLPLMDVVLLEQAWDRVAAGDEQRALGLVVGLGAPVFRDLFAPERYLIRAMALRRLCQYRASNLTVREFRATYGSLLEKIRNGAPLRSDPNLVAWATNGTPPLDDYARMRDLLKRENANVSSISDKALRDHLTAFYANSINRYDGLISRNLDKALEQVAAELLRVDEKMNLIVYEIAAGLFKTGDADKSPRSTGASEIPYSSDSVYFKFDGEYWSDELGNYTVFSEGRCLK